ncbi:MAG: acyl-CoA dehydrogenase family protein [Syntrophobacteraceae bacterium]
MIMEKIYRGQFDPDLIRLGSPNIDEAKIAQIVGRYSELFKDHLARGREADGVLPAPLIDKMAESGLFGLTVDTQYGGGGLNLCEYLKVVEQIARLDIPIAFTFLAHLSIGIKAIQLFGSLEQKQKYLPLAASGQMIFAFALTEPHIGSDAQHIETTATLSPDQSHYVLNGKKTYITNANYAGGMTVFAQLDPRQPGFIGAFIVETAWEGVQVGKEMPKMGLTSSSTAPVHFKDVRVPRQNLLGTPGEGFKIAMSVLNYGRLSLGASSASFMRLSAGEMLKRASSRIQFQVPIGNFQLIQEKIVHARVGEAVSSAMNDLAAAALQDNPLLTTAVETSHCKLFGTTRAWETAYEALQTAGGAGYLKTLPYEKRMRDIRVTTVFEGTTEVHSIYPALWGMRMLAKSLKDSGRSGLWLAGELVKLLVKGPQWPAIYEDSLMRQGLKEAQRCARATRVLLLSAILLHGKKIARGQSADKEFLLRRITTLSLYTFGLLALLRQTEIKQKAGALHAEDSILLQYFIAETKMARKANRRLLDSRRERLTSALYREFSTPPPQGGDKTV